MMSANSPGLIRARSLTPIRSALTSVAARIASIGAIPRSTSAHSSLALSPWGIAGALVPHAIRSPALIARRRLAFACGKTSSAFARSAG